MTKLFSADEMPIKTSGRPSLLVLGFWSVQDEAATSSHALFHWIPPATFTVTVQTGIVNKSHKAKFAPTCVRNSLLSELS